MALSYWCTNGAPGPWSGEACLGRLSNGALFELMQVNSAPLHALGHRLLPKVTGRRPTVLDWHCIFQSTRARVANTWNRLTACL
eukprot:s861_g19.t1